MAVTVKNAAPFGVTPCGSCNNRRCDLLDSANGFPNSLILFMLMMEAIRSFEASVFTRATQLQPRRRHCSWSPRLIVSINVVRSSLIFPPWWWRRYSLRIRRFLHEPHGVTSQKTALLKASDVYGGYAKLWPYSWLLWPGTVPQTPQPVKVLRRYTNSCIFHRIYICTAFVQGLISSRESFCVVFSLLTDPSSH
jgi:hypothetical protein